MRIGLRMIIVDDDPLMLESLSDALAKKGYEVRTFRRAREALDELKETRTDVLVVDLKMPDMDGLELLRAVREFDSELTVIMMTAYSTIATAVQAMKAGAYDYLQKPFAIDELDMLVRRALEGRRLQKQQGYLTRSQQAVVEEGRLIGESQGLLHVKEMIRKVAPSESTVLVQGESGTGKELVARHIHQGSPRKDQIFVPINIAAIPESLLESELFGHVKGAFTNADRNRKGLFEVAEGGTLFLDEISETSPAVQAKLLRAIEQTEVRPVGSSRAVRTDVRLITSTNADLSEAIAAGRFREDLFYRLNVFPITLPPLRERRKDIPRLAEHFLARFCRRLKKDTLSISPEALDILAGYDWPGNVRELEHVIERAIIVEEGPEITPASLFLRDLAKRRGGPGATEDFFEKTFRDARSAFEKTYLITRLSRAKRGDTMTALADQLGIHRTTLYELIHRHGISMDKL